MGERVATCIWRPTLTESAFCRPGNFFSLQNRLFSEFIWVPTTDERFSDPTLSHYCRLLQASVWMQARHFNLRNQLADAISHLTLICGFKSVKRLIFTHFVMGMLYTKTYINFTRRPSICNELQMWTSSR